MNRRSWNTWWLVVSTSNTRCRGQFPRPKNLPCQNLRLYRHPWYLPILFLSNSNRLYHRWSTWQACPWTQSFWRDLRLTSLCMDSTLATSQWSIWSTSWVTLGWTTVSVTCSSLYSKCAALDQEQACRKGFPPTMGNKGCHTTGNMLNNSRQLATMEGCRLLLLLRWPGFHLYPSNLIPWCFWLRCSTSPYFSDSLSTFIPHQQQGGAGPASRVSPLMFPPSGHLSVSPAPQVLFSRIDLSILFAIFPRLPGYQAPRRWPCSPNTSCSR